MAKKNDDENDGDDAPRKVWEEVIGDLRKKAAESYDDDAPEVCKEKARIIKGYKKRFGDPYPESVS
jgi:hypothetical protein